MISRWHLETTRDRLWELLINPTDWPDWWPHLAGVSKLASGDRDGIGAQHAFYWRSGLGYALRVVITCTRAQRFQDLEGTASGDLHGIGLWIIEDGDAGGLRLTYRWDVQLNRPWMRLFLPLLRPVFAWRHFAVMASGAQGMARRLGCRLSENQEWSALTRVAEDPPRG